MAQDFLKECLTDVNNVLKKSVPIDAVQKEFCTVCLNSQCSRAGISQGSFFQRSRTWEKDLFIDPSRVPDTDPMVSKVQRIWNPSGSVNLIPPAPQISHFVAPEIAKNTESISPVEPAINEEEVTPLPGPEDKTITQPVVETVIKPPTGSVKKVVNPFAPVGKTSDTADKNQSDDVVLSSGGTFTFG